MHEEMVNIVVEMYLFHSIVLFVHQLNILFVEIIDEVKEINEWLIHLKECDAYWKFFLPLIKRDKII
jgi:hypothetical protein